MERKNNAIFNEVMAAREEKRISHLMGFKHGWNKEIIARFYAIVYLGHHESERAMFWMTEEQKYHITFPEFVSLFRLGNTDMEYPKLHDAGVIEPKEMHLLYLKNMRGSWGKVNGLYTYYGFLNRLFRKT
jgi:hypothetical protein